MFLTTKIERIVIVLAALTITLLGQGFPQSAAKSGSEPAVEAFVIKNEVTKMQETLRDKGYFSGKIDGIFGLRTRESIRAYQRAEKFPVTGQVDQRTAAGLGLRPEVSWDDSEPGVIQASDKTESETAEGKPSANIKWTNGSRRDSKKLRKPVKPVATTKGPGEHGASPPQAASGSRTQ